MRVSAFAAAFLLAAFAPGVAKPSGVAVTPASREALIALEAPRLAVEYVVGLSTYDPAARQLKSGTFSGGWVNMKVRRYAAGENTHDLIVQKVNPGTYVLRDVSQQATWGICYHARTYQFEVKAGQVLHLGVLDGRSALKELHRQVVQSYQRSARLGYMNHYFDAIPAPPLTPVNGAALAKKQTMLAAALPQTTSVMEAANLVPATFGTGKDAFGLTRVCGGWRQKKGKPPVHEPPAPAE